MYPHMHYVYIMASRPNGTIYVGRTGDLIGRAYQHREGRASFTQRYRIDRLVWFEGHDEFESSLRRERQLKRWRRTWKNALIAETNPDWDDLLPSLRAP